MDTIDLVQPSPRFAKTHARASAVRTRANQTSSYMEALMTIIGGAVAITAGLVRLINLLSPDRDENSSTK